MAEALYRKYRPQTFDDVVGQTHIERTLKNAIESDKVSHAYLFCGPRGTGKTTTARLLAKALLCEGGPTPAPDGTCEQCTAIAEGTHPDVNEMDAASRTGVENVREEIIGRVQYAPTRGRYKIYIIDEVHMLSVAAFNALLKTLEEPPDHVVFIMCTTDPQKVPETIHSRCQRFDFHRLSVEEIISRLGAVCMAEGVEFEGDALDLVAHRAQGGMRDALTALEQLIAFGGGKVTVEVAQNVLGSLDTSEMVDIVRHIGNRDAAACFTWMSEYVETGADLAQFARDLASYVRDLYVLSLTDGAMAVNASQSALPGMKEEAALFGVDRIAYVLRVLGDLNTELRTAANPRLSFEIALTRMVRPQSDLTLESLAARVEALEAALAQGAPIAAAPAVAGAAGAAMAGAAPAAKPAAQAVAPTVPPVSSGYRAAPSFQPTAAAEGARPSAASRATASMDKAAAFRANLEHRRAPQTAVESVSAGRASGRSAPASASNSSQPLASAGMPSAAVAHHGADAHAEKPVGQSSAASAAQVAVPATQAVAPDQPTAADAGIAAKLLNPAAMQRGWQAAIADLKRQRAAYGALLLSARASAEADGSGVVVAFSRENSFAYTAAQKPDIQAALASALQTAFGGPVPFRIVQGEGGVRVPATAPAGAADPSASSTASASSSHAPEFSAPQPSGRTVVSPGAPANRPSSIPATAATPPASSHLAPWEHEQAPYSDDDVVPYDDADIYAYGGEESYGGSPFDEAGDTARVNQQGQATRHVYNAEERVSGSDEEEPEAEREPEVENKSEAVEFAMGVEGPKPVDPYLVGKELGFDSMPNPHRKVKGMVLAAGWPGVSVKPPRKKSFGATAESDDGTAAAPDTPASEEASAEAASTAEQVEAPVAPVAPEPPLFDPSKVKPTGPNPFADRRMPTGIGGVGPREESAPAFVAPRVAPGEEMDIADIFGAFGVSMDKVEEER